MVRLTWSNVQTRVTSTNSDINERIMNAALVQFLVLHVAGQQVREVQVTCRQHVASQTKRSNGIGIRNTRAHTHQNIPSRQDKTNLANVPIDFHAS
jgi:hypothetical protein